MNKIKAVLAIALPLAFSASVAHAGGDIGGDEGPAFSWSGAYAGFQVGYAWDNSSDIPWGDPVGSPLVENDGPLVFDTFTGGVHLGYNFQNGSIVWGIEGDLEIAPGKGDDEDRGGHTNGIDSNWMASIRGRIGYASGDSLLYLTGGYAYLDADAVVRDIVSQPDIETGFHGWTVGIGWEKAVAHNMTLRVGYNYTDFDLKVEDYNVVDYSLGFQPEIHSVKIGVSAKF